MRSCGIAGDQGGRGAQCVCVWGGGAQGRVPGPVRPWWPARLLPLGAQNAPKHSHPRHPRHRQQLAPMGDRKARLWPKPLLRTRGSLRGQHFGFRRERACARCPLRPPGTSGPGQAPQIPHAATSPTAPTCSFCAFPGRAQLAVPWYGAFAHCSAAAVGGTRHTAASASVSTAPAPRPQLLPRSLRGPIFNIPGPRSGK